jgi:hypothetical protein
MNSRTLILFLGLLGVSLAPAPAAQPSANQVLHEMSSTLAAAQTFSFSATREIDVALVEGIDLAGGKAKIDALVQRPGKLAIRSTGKTGTRQFLADGRTLTIYESKTNLYSVSPIPGTIDSLADELDEKYDFTPPLIEFAVSNPYNDLRRDSPAAVYLGRGRVTNCFLGLGGVECDRIMLKGEVADAELWVGVSDHLPHKLVATFKQLPSQPQLRVFFHRWNLAASATDADFTFTPPKGAMKIEMWSVSKMQQATGSRR